jgi:hypothetical protein
MVDANRAGEVGGNVVWRPVWGPPFQAWAAVFVERNLWRVDRLFERDDAMQECAIIFIRCCRHYDGRVTNAAWFMSLFMRAVVNNFHTFARRNRRFYLAEAAAVEQARERAAFGYSEGPLFTALSRASSELIEVCRVLASAPNELLSLMLSGIGSARDEAAVSRVLCRLARVRNVRSDLLSELRALLREE